MMNAVGKNKLDNLDDLKNKEAQKIHSVNNSPVHLSKSPYGNNKNCYKAKSSFNKFDSN